MRLAHGRDSLLLYRLSLLPVIIVYSYKEKASRFELKCEKFAYKGRERGKKTKKQETKKKSLYCKLHVPERAYSSSLYPATPVQSADVRQWKDAPQPTHEAEESRL